MHLPQRKITATAIHFLLSAVIFSSFILILKTAWYPEPHFTASGGWQGLKIVAFIDVILGPLLTFILYKKTKPIKTLRFDLGSILVIQLAALSWGVFTIYQQRPIALAFWEYRFYTVSYKEVADPFRGSSELKKLLSDPLGFFYVPKPISESGINNLIAESQAKNLAPFELIDRYQPAKEYVESITRHGVDIEEIITVNAEMAHQLSTLLEPFNARIHDFHYIPLISRYQNIVFVFSKEDFEAVGYLKAPYKEEKHQPGAHHQTEHIRLPKTA